MAKQITSTFGSKKIEEDRLKKQKEIISGIPKVPATDINIEADEQIARFDKFLGTPEKTTSKLTTDISEVSGQANLEEFKATGSAFATPKVTTDPVDVVTPEVTTDGIETPVPTLTDEEKIIAEGEKAKGLVGEITDKTKDKIEEKRGEAIDQAFESDILARGEFEKNKGFFVNFDEVNDKFNSIMDNVREIRQGQEGDLTDEQIKELSIKLGVTEDEIKIPGDYLRNNVQLTDEGKDKFGVTSAQDLIDKQKLNFERGKEDIAFQLEGAKTQLNNQIDDVRRQLAKNVAFAESQGAFTGDFKSSGFTQGIENIKDDGERTINRLESMLARIKGASGTNLKRLTEDFTKANQKATEDLNKQMDELRFSTGIQMNTAVNEFGGGESLASELDKIAKNFDGQSQQAMTSYLSNIRQIQLITNENLDRQEKIITKIKEQSDKKFNEIISNQGVFENTSLVTLMNNVNRGELTPERLADIRKMMTSSIRQTLSDSGTVSTADLKNIETLLEQGKTPLEIVAQMQGLSKFTPIIDEKADTQQIVETDEQQFSNIVITQNYGDPSPLKEDNVRLADGTIGTPGIDIDGFIGESLNSPISGIVFDFIKSNTGLGNRILIEDNQGNVHYFNHLDKANVKKGDIVSSGDLIGTIGNSGSVIPGEGGDGSHLDYRVKSRAGEWINPSEFLGFDRKEGELTDFQEQEKEAILEQVRTGNILKSEFSNVRIKAIKEGRGEEFTKTLGNTAKGKIAQGEDNLRKEFNNIPAVKNFKLAEKTVNELKNMLQAQTGAGDMAAIFSFMKALDPTSVVRESEFASAADTSGILDKVKSLSLWRKAKNGEILTPNQRKAFLAVTQQVLITRKEKYEEKIEQFSRLATDRGLNKKNVILELGLEPKELSEQERTDIKAQTRTKSIQRLIELRDEGVFISPRGLEMIEEFESNQFFN